MDGLPPRVDAAPEAGLLGPSWLPRSKGLRRRADSPFDRGYGCFWQRGYRSHWFISAGKHGSEDARPAFEDDQE
jgi:hypothetical protein